MTCHSCQRKDPSYIAGEGCIICNKDQCEECCYFLKYNNKNIPVCIRCLVEYEFNKHICCVCEELTPDYIIKSISLRYCKNCNNKYEINGSHKKTFFDLDKLIIIDNEC